MLVLSSITQLENQNYRVGLRHAKRAQVVVTMDVDAATLFHRASFEKLVYEHTGQRLIRGADQETWHGYVNFLSQGKEFYSKEEMWSELYDD
jgi:hypothetical protein